MQNPENFIELNLENCFNKVEIKWTDNLIQSMKENWKKELSDTDFEETNNIDEYCDCLINEYKNHPLGKIIEDGFNESKIGISIDSICTEKSKK